MWTCAGCNADVLCRARSDAQRTHHRTAGQNFSHAYKPPRLAAQGRVACRVEAGRPQNEEMRLRGMAPFDGDVSRKQARGSKGVRGQAGQALSPGLAPVGAETRRAKDH